MDIARATVALALACAACAQQVGRHWGDITTVECNELTVPLTERHGPAFDVNLFCLALRSLIAFALQQDDPHARVQLTRAKGLYITSQVAATHELALRALEAVRAGTLEVRVQCTVFPRPAAEMPPGKIADVVPIDEVAAGRMLKAAVAAGGTIQNLPETSAPSLAAFAAQASLTADDAPTVPPREKPAAPPATTAAEVRCRALVLGDDEAALAVTMAGMPLPDGEVFVRLKVGAGAMLTFRGKEHTNCVWLRIVALRRIEPGSTPAQPRPVK